MYRASDINPRDWRAVEDAVLCFVRDSDANQVLLIHKKTGLGAGLINAPGGRVKPGEQPAAAAIRETMEEVGLVVEDVRHAADLYFQFLDGHSIRGYVFETLRWSGTPEATREADPFWCDEGRIPYDRMWTDDSWWLPHMLRGRYVSGRFVFDGETMLSMSLDVERSKTEEGLPKNQMEENP